VRALALLLLLVGAPASALAAEPVTDMLGRRVAAPARPVRVVSLAPSLTEIAYAVGAGDRLVAVTDNCDFPPEVARKPRIGGIYNPNFEAILTARPDLVLATTEGNREEHLKRLEALGLALYIVKPTDLTSVLEAIGRVGGVLGQAAETERLVAALRRDADTVGRAVEGARRPRVLYVVWGNPLIVPGRDTLITDLIRRAGGESVSGGEPQEYPRYSMEEALARRPDRIVLGGHGRRSVEEHLRLWPQLRLLAAAREGRVGLVDGDLTHRSGPRVIEALRDLARLIHPEVAW
jgi:iron complex transport system substrate-binding protein